MTAVAERPPQTKEEQPYIDPAKKRHTGIKLLIILAVWLIGWVIFRGKDTLAQPFDYLTPFQQWLNHLRDSIQTALQSGLLRPITTISNWINDAVNWLEELVSHPAPPRPVPEIGWLGVVALFGWIALFAAGIRYALMVVVGTLLFGFMGLWTDSIDTIIVTVLAVVVSIVIGLPIGIAMARRPRVSKAVTPLLDAMQTMPSFAYLIPVSIIFGIGAACAVVLTIIYALPPLVRITEHGLKSVSGNTQEAARSLGVTRRQLLRQVQVPMARRTIVVGINQCTLAALSMLIISVYVSGPGLGQDVLQALQTLNIGGAAVPGLLIVVIAIMFDRTTTAASERRDLQNRGVGMQPRTRLIVLAASFVVVLVCVYLSRTYLQLAQFPNSLNVGPDVANWISSATNTIVNAIDTFTQAFKNLITNYFLNPLQDLVSNVPWWLIGPVLAAFAWVLGGTRALVVSVISLIVILAVGVFNDTMVTLTMTIVATVLVMILAVAVGVWMGRGRRVELFIRPILDAFQTIPSFVYLVPALALFASSRFTAIVAAVAFSFPVATKLVSDGIRGVSSTTVEAAQSSGVTRWQMIGKVQLPMARPSLVLATNQGLLYVLSMVVIGGAVGGGSLGYIIISGFDQSTLFGKGFAAAIAITALGIMIDRVARGAAARTAE